MPYWISTVIIVILCCWLVVQERSYKKELAKIKAKEYFRGYYEGFTQLTVLEEKLRAEGEDCEYKEKL